jgi:uncharacterized membrane protein
VLGATFAALAAATFALNNAMTRRGVLTGSVAQALAVGVPIGVPMFFLFALVSGGLASIASFPGEMIALMAGTGVLHFMIGRYCNFRSVKAVGANLSGPIVQTSLLVTLVLAVTVLYEQLTTLRLAGIALVLLGLALMRGSDPAPAPSISPGAAGGGRSVAAGPPPFQPNYAEGYVFGLLAAAAYGVTPILVRIAVERGGLADSIAAGLISYVSATAAIGLLLLWPGQFRHVLAVNRVSAKWFAWSGIVVTASQALFYMALVVAPVSVVMPVLQLHLAFRYVLARLMNPHHEVFGSQMVLTMTLSLIGAAALSLDPDLVSETLRLPEWLAAFLRRSWF